MTASVATTRDATVQVVLEADALRLFAGELAGIEPVAGAHPRVGCRRAWRHDRHVVDERDAESSDIASDK
jgi:hypothetical protein